MQASQQKAYAPREENHNRDDRVKIPRNQKNFRERAAFFFECCLKAAMMVVVLCVSGRFKMKKWQRPSAVARELGVNMQVMLELISDGAFLTSRDAEGKLWCAPSELPVKDAEHQKSPNFDGDAVVRLAERHAEDLKRLHGELKANEIAKALAEAETARHEKDLSDLGTQLESVRKQLDDLHIRMEFERKRATMLERATTRPWYQFTEKAADLRQANAMRLALPAE